HRKRCRACVMRLLMTESIMTVMIVVTSTQQTLGSPRVDLADDRVARGADNRDLVGVILRHVESLARPVERHAERVTVELDPRAQMARTGRGNVDSYDLTIAIGRHVGCPALYSYRKWVGATDTAVRAFVVGKVRAQIVLVANGLC